MLGSYLVGDFFLTIEWMGGLLGSIIYAFWLLFDFLLSYSEIDVFDWVCRFELEGLLTNIILVCLL